MLRRETCLALGLIAVACGSPQRPDAGVEDAGGEVDLVPPTLVSTLPPPGAAAVTVDAVVVLEFSEPMAPGSVGLTATPPLTFSAPAVEGATVTFTPAAPLAWATSYTLTVTGTDVAGNALAGLAAFTFTTRGQPDRDPPSVTRFSPTGSGVALDAGLTVEFSEPMDPGSLSFTLSPPLAVGPAVLDQGDTRASFGALEPLAPSTAYTAVVSGTDAAGNALTGATSFTFTTAALPDTTSPTVRTISPADAATGVPQSASISVTFSERMNTAVTQAAFSLRKQGGATVTGAFRWAIDSALLTFDPAGDLDPASVYLVSITVSARDVAGNPLARAFSASFTTASTLDKTAPSVVEFAPPNGARGLARCDWTVSITFSEPMDTAATQGAILVNQTSPVARTIPLSFEWNRESTRVTLSRRTATPAAPCFDHGAEVNVEVGTTAEDLAGNHPAAATTSFLRVVLQGSRGVVALPNVSHSIFSNGAVNTASLWLGEASTPGLSVRTLLTFSLTTLPAGAKITQATLRVRLASVTSEPFGSLGPIYVDSVNYGITHDASDYATPVLASCPTVPPPSLCAAVPFHVQFASAPWAGERSLDVTRAVYADQQRGDPSQFRLLFLNESSANGRVDSVRLGGGTSSIEMPLMPTLTVVYDFP
jgi:hypothetical protein